jgi:hypothetical protein
MREIGIHLHPSILLLTELVRCLLNLYIVGECSVMLPYLQI